MSCDHIELAERGATYLGSLNNTAQTKKLTKAKPRFQKAEQA